MVTAGMTIPLCRQKSAVTKVFTSAPRIGAFIFPFPDRLDEALQHASGRNAKPFGNSPKDLILRSRAWRGVSKDGMRRTALMVRAARRRAPHHEVSSTS